MLEHLNRCTITNLDGCEVNDVVHSTYDYDELSLQELLCQYFKKINECIDDVNKYSELVKNLLTWIEQEGLEKEVLKLLNKWKIDGTLKEIIDEQVFTDITTRLTKLEGKTDYFATLEMFGAKGDGISDDSDAIQKALDSEFEIHINKKTYIVNKGLTIKKTKKVIAEKGAKFKYPTVFSETCLVITGENVHLYGLEIEGGINWVERNDKKGTSEYNAYWNLRNSQKKYEGIQILNTKNVIIDNCVVSKTMTGVLVYHSELVNINNCHCHHTIADVFPIYSGSHDVKIDNCLAEFAGDDGFPVWAYLGKSSQFEQAYNIIISNCRANNINSRAFINHGGKDITFLNNYAYHCWWGFAVKGDDGSEEYKVKDAIDTKLINNTVVSGAVTTVPPEKKLSNMYIQLSRRVLVIGNTFKFDNDSPYEDCIFIQSSDDVKIVYNTITGGKINTDQFNTLNKFSNRLDVSNNTFKDCIKRIIEGKYIKVLNFKHNLGFNINTTSSQLNGNNAEFNECNDVYCDTNNIEGNINLRQVTNGVIEGGEKYKVNSACTNIICSTPYIASDRPTATRFTKGSMWLNTHENKLYVKINTDWQQINVT